MVPAVSSARVQRDEKPGGEGREGRLQSHTPNRGYAGRRHPRQRDPSRLSTGFGDHSRKRQRSSSPSQKPQRQRRPCSHSQGGFLYLGCPRSSSRNNATPTSFE